MAKFGFIGMGNMGYAMLKGLLSCLLYTSYKDAPNVDGLVFVECDRELMSGDFVNVLITGSTEYDLIGEIVEE